VRHLDVQPFAGPPQIPPPLYPAGQLTEAKRLGQLREGASPESLARVLVASFFGAQHISWALNDRTDIVDRVQETIDAILPLHQCSDGARAGNAPAHQNARA